MLPVAGVVAAVVFSTGGVPGVVGVGGDVAEVLTEGVGSEIVPEF